MHMLVRHTYVKEDTAQKKKKLTTDIPPVDVCGA